jgi:Ca-activated chloride channel family protein
MVRRAGIALLGAAAIVTAAGTVQGSRPARFGTAVDVVQLNVSVTDTHRRYVTGLGERDFAVYEDGAPQAVSFFSGGDLPFSLALLIDGSASMEETLPVARKAAARFVATMRPRDLACVTQFNERVTVLQDFTADHASLERAIDATHAEGTTALYTALYVSLRELRAQQASAEEGRRRAIVLLTDGEDTVSAVSEEQVIELARRADVTVYAISLPSGSRSLIVRDQASHFLATLTRDTGGEVHYPRSLADLEGLYGRIADELRTQYTLGYVSANRVRDGGWRHISVRTPARNDLLVRYRLGYYAPRR